MSEDVEEAVRKERKRIVEAINYVADSFYDASCGNSEAEKTVRKALERLAQAIELLD